MFSLRGFLINTAIFAVGAVPASADDLFFDSFESGDLNTSQNGFEWGGDGSTGNVTVSTERAYSGQHSLRFLFRGKPAGQDSTAEQRFSLGGEFTELWVQWKQHFPTNYRHRDDSPGNNKFLMLWSKDYSGSEKWGNTISLNLWPDGSSGGSTVAYNTVDKWGHRPKSADGGYPNLINLDEDLGQWIEFTFHWKLQSGSGTGDGILQFWKKVGDGPYQEIFSYHGLNNTWGPDWTSWPDYNFLDKGYLLGWANSGFDEDTVIYVDDFRVSTQPLMDIGSRPNAPKPVEVN